MDIVVNFGPAHPSISVSFPDEGPFYEVLVSVKRAVEQHAVRVFLESDSVASLPTHGTIEFVGEEDRLYVNAEGQWWLYVEPKHYRVTDAVLRMINNIPHVRMKVSDQ